MEKKNFIIAIDGHSSTGKSTLAKQLANKLNFLYIDTGAMYRAVTWFAIQKGLVSQNHFDKKGLIKELKNIHIDFVLNPQSGEAEVLLNGKNIEKEIRSMEVSNLVSPVAAIPEVRKKLVAEQRKMAENHSVVMDGRDIGSVVFPHADLKIFMTASPEVRAKRRFKELKEKGQKVTYEEVFQNVTQRDKMDSEREDSPLIKTEDAVEIDNSTITKEEQLEKILQIVKQRKS